MERTKTARGFELGKFTDLYGASCSVQASSLATEPAIWLGTNDAEPKVLHSDAKKLGVATDATCGWVDYPLPKEVLLNTRMHLNQAQVAELLPVLQRFVDTGEI